MQLKAVLWPDFGTVPCAFPSERHVAEIVTNCRNCRRTDNAALNYAVLGKNVTACATVIMIRCKILGLLGFSPTNITQYILTVTDGMRA